MPADDSGWSAPPKPEDLVAPWDGRDPNPTAAQTLGRPFTAPQVAELHQTASDRHHRGRRILCRCFALLSILGLGGSGLIAFGNETFSGYYFAVEAYPLFGGLCVMVPAAVYGVFSRFAVLRFSAVTAACFAALCASTVLILAILDHAAQGYGTTATELSAFCGVLALSLATTGFSAWLIHLELERLRRRHPAPSVLWQAQAAPESPAAPTPAAKPPPDIARALLRRRQRWLYRPLAVLPMTAFTVLLMYRFIYRGFSQGHDRTAFLALALVIPILVVLALVPWRPATWLKFLSIGAGVSAGFAGGCSLGAYMLLQRAINERYMSNFFYFTYYAYAPTTFGQPDPNLTIFTFFMLALILACLTCSVVAFRLLRHELAAFRQTAAPLPAVPPALPRKERAEEDLTPDGHWDQAAKP